MFDKYENLATLMGFEPGSQRCDLNALPLVVAAHV